MAFFHHLDTKKCRYFSLTPVSYVTDSALFGSILFQRAPRERVRKAGPGGLLQHSRQLAARDAAARAASSAAREDTGSVPKQDHHPHRGRLPGN